MTYDFGGHCKGAGGILSYTHRFRRWDSTGFFNRLILGLAFF
jgi:hypothetical protein